MTKYLGINQPTLFFDKLTGELSGENTKEKIAKIGDLKGIFADEETRQNLDQDKIVYRVQYYFPIDEGTEGGLFFGNTTIYPGKVGNEYFMTKGHFHAKGDRGEYYWCIQGRGILLFMDRNRNTWAEEMTTGSLHYMPENVAHRTINVGSDAMTFGACWPSDAGHDYGTILEQGFSARMLDINSKPELVNNESTNY